MRKGSTMPPRAVGDEMISFWRSLRDRGWSYKRIAMHTGKKEGTVQGILTEGERALVKPVDRPRSLTAKQEQQIRERCVNSPTRLSAPDLVGRLKSIGVLVSPSTVRRALTHTLPTGVQRKLSFQPFKRTEALKDLIVLLHSSIKTLVLGIYIFMNEEVCFCVYFAN